MVVLAQLAGLMGIILVLTFLLSRVAWGIGVLFFGLNRLQWFLYNPLRFLFKNRYSGRPWALHNFLLFSGIGPTYWILVHLFTIPLRLLNALYFNAILAWSLMMHDSLAELIKPQLGRYRYLKGWKYAAQWLFGLPWRLGVFLAKNLVAVVEACLMIGFDTVWLTLTMYHGTEFEGQANDIAQKGRWYVGPGAYAGSGINFCMHRQVGVQYARVPPESSRAVQATGIPPVVSLTFIHVIFIKSSEPVQ